MPQHVGKDEIAVSQRSVSCSLINHATSENGGSAGFDRQAVRLTDTSTFAPLFYRFVPDFQSTGNLRSLTNPPIHCSDYQKYRSTRCSLQIQVSGPTKSQRKYCHQKSADSEIQSMLYTVATKLLNLPPPTSAAVRLTREWLSSYHTIRLEPMAQDHWPIVRLARRLELFCLLVALSYEPLDPLRLDLFGLLVTLHCLRPN